MSYTSLLINTCTIRRFAEGLPDAYGVKVKTWADHLVDEACRWSIPSNREVKVGAEVVLADLQLLLRANTDITEQDRVVLDGVTYEVLYAADKQNKTANHHVKCMMRCVR